MFIGLVLFLFGCPDSNVDPFVSDTPEADVTSVTKQTRKTAVFTLTSIHPINSIWRAYDTETDGVPLVDVDVSYLKSQNKLTLTYRHNDLPAGMYWVSIKEPGKDESLRLGLTVE